MFCSDSKQKDYLRDKTVDSLLKRYDEDSAEVTLEQMEKDRAFLESIYKTRITFEDDDSKIWLDKARPAQF